MRHTTRLTAVFLVVASFLISACGSGGGDAVRSSETAALRSNSKQPNPLCVAPWGVDLCAATGVNTAFMVPIDFGGAPIPAGNWWTPILGWGTNAPGGLPGLPLTYPPGYVTTHPDDPMQDFLSKIVKFTIIVDPGTRQERSYVYEDPAKYAVLMKIVDFWGPGGLGLPELDAGQWVAFVPSLHPLSVGAHEMHFIWTLSALHCDGVPSLGGEPLTVEGGHCFPAGDYAFIPLQHVYKWTVVPR